MQRLELLKERVQSHREVLINHPVYSSLRSLNDLSIFMEHHVFAVWDFMSLLKSLQSSLTCTQVPWIPVGSANTRYLINEIVVGEESDVDQNGQRMSHFEMYLKAMKEVGCKTNGIENFLMALRNGKSISESLNDSAPEGAASFVRDTFQFIEQGKPHVVAAVFTFGREDLIPDMFLSLINEMSKELPSKTETIRYYVERHIEIDGDHHSKLAYEMTSELCGDDEQKWEEATQAVEKALISRKMLWDKVYDDILQHELIIK